jgi:hypothetical protein
MSRKIALLFFAVSVTVISACSNLTAPRRDDPLDPDDSTAYCGVVVGTHTCGEPS